MWPLIILSILGGISTLVGMILLFRERKLVKADESFFFAFAVGTLIGIAFFLMIPKALELSESAILYVLAGFVGFYLLDNILVMNAYQEEEHNVKEVGLGGAIGYSFYHIFNGFVLALGFFIDTKLGIIMGIALALYYLPEGTSIVTNFLHSSLNKSKIMRYMVTIILLTPIAAIASYYIIPNMDLNMGKVLAFAAGTFIYTAASDIAPDPYRRKGGIDIICFLIGLALVFLLISVL